MVTSQVDVYKVFNLVTNINKWPRWLNFRRTFLAMCRILGYLSDILKYCTYT